MSMTEFFTDAARQRRRFAGPDPRSAETRSRGLRSGLARCRELVARCGLTAERDPLAGESGRPRELPDDPSMVQHHDHGDDRIRLLL
jgi:hypothetical protein